MTCVCACGCRAALTRRDFHCDVTRCQPCRQKQTPRCLRVTPTLPPLTIRPVEVSAAVVDRMLQRFRLEARYARAMQKGLPSL